MSIEPTSTAPLDPAFVTTDDWPERLIAARRKRGLSQAALAREVGISQSAIADYERGRSKPGFQIFMRLAETLNLEASILAAGPTAVDKEVERASKQVPGFQWTDRSEYDSEWKLFAKEFAKIFTADGTKIDPDPATFAEGLRIMWMNVLLMPQDIALHERSRLMLSQVRIMFRSAKS